MKENHDLTHAFIESILIAQEEVKAEKLKPYKQNKAQKNSPVPVELAQKGQASPIKVRYTNYRGETAVRTIVPIYFYFGSIEYHPHEQWLIEVWDMQKKALRTYALRDISQWFVE